MRITSFTICWEEAKIRKTSETFFATLYSQRRVYASQSQWKLDCFIIIWVEFVFITFSAYHIRQQFETRSVLSSFDVNNYHRQKDYNSLMLQKMKRFDINAIVAELFFFHVLDVCDDIKKNSHIFYSRIITIILKMYESWISYRFHCMKIILI